MLVVYAPFLYECPRGTGAPAGALGRSERPSECGRRWVDPLPGWRLVTDWPVVPHGLLLPPVAPDVPPRLRLAPPGGPSLLVSVHSGLSAPLAPVPASPSALPSLEAPPCASLMPAPRSSECLPYPRR